ncbi:MAG: YndJ family transporter [Planctomycetes bacterium]|nr:YndJ family transporter [Planctomycetota bacterium]
MVALGITSSAFGVRFLEPAATIFLATACAAFAILQMRAARKSSSRLAASLLVASSTSLLAAMALAVAYAVGSFFEAPWLDIPLMLSTHGVLQAFGFALPGVIGWRMFDGCPQGKRG